MDNTQRLIENELTFKELNARIKDATAHILGQAPSSGLPLAFYCECASLNCDRRIEVEPSEWERIHRDPALFCIAPQHDLPKIEKVTTKNPDYWVVSKAQTQSPLLAKEANGFG